MGAKWCACAEKLVYDECDGCYDDYWIEEGIFEEPPLYKPGALAAMSPEALVKERDRQHGIHDSAVDRCEEINSPTIEDAAARARMVQAELTRRGFDPYADEPERSPTAIEQRGEG